MIFSSDEKEFLQKTIKRKSLEISMISNMDASEATRSSILDQLSADIFRCRMMIDLADGELCSLYTNMNILTTNLEATAPELYQKYMELLPGMDLVEEEQYLRLFNRLLSHVPDFAAAFDNVFCLLSGKDLFTNSEISDLIKTKNMMGEYGSIISNIRHSNDVSLIRSSEYASFCAEECSIMLRIHSGKPVSFDEISRHMDWSRSVDRESFVRIFSFSMTDDEKALWESFDSEWDRRMQVCMGRAICDQMYGSPSTAGLISYNDSISIHG